MTTERPISRFKLRQAKRTNAYIRERLVRRGLERSSKMMESFNADWTTVYGDMLDRFRNSDLGQFSAASTANDRRFGQNFPIAQTEVDLARLRMPSRILCSTNNYAIGLLTGLTSYVIGDGYKYKVAPISGMEDACPKELTASCQAIIDDFAKVNDWNGSEQPSIEDELFWRSCEDGEFFLRLFPQADGRTFLRTVEPEQVTAPPGMSQAEGMFGVITPENDTQDVRGYYVFYGVDVSNGSVVHKDEIVHLRRNVKRSIKRGMPDFSFSSYDTLMLADKLRRAIGLGASIQASIAWVRQHEAATDEQVQSAIDALDNKDWNAPNPNTGKEDRYARFEPGTILDIDKGQTYTPPPSAGANGTAHLAILQMLAQAGGNRWNAPAWLATADNTSANYATALTEESPFVKTVTRTQRQYKGAFVRPYWFALQHFVQTRGGIVVNVKRGEAIEQNRYSWDDIKRLIDIQVEAHSPEVRNKTEEAQANQIRIQGGWKSPQTVQAEEGLDGDREKTNILEWRDEMGAVGQQLPDGSMDPFAAAVSGNPEPRPTPESRLLEAKDASGHEHAADGKFGTGGTKKTDDKKSDAKPKHGERAATAHSKYHELIAQAKQARIDAFNEVKADAQAAHAKAGEHAKSISAIFGNIAWDTDYDEPFNDLDTEISYRPDDTDSVKERYDSFKSIEEAANAALKHTQATEKADDNKLAFTPDEIKHNKKSLQTIISHAREARNHLKAYVQHRKEMKAIKAGESDVKESLATEVEKDWASVLESLDDKTT